MTFELRIVAAVVLIAAAYLLATTRGLGTRAAIVLAVLATLAAGWALDRRLVRTDAARAGLAAEAPRQEHPDAFVRSEKCRGCHPAEYATWHASYHRTMTQFPSVEAVRGDFDGVVLEVEGTRVELMRAPDGFVAAMPEPDWLKENAPRRDWGHRPAGTPPPTIPPNGPRATVPITLLTGSHHMQAYWVPSRLGNRQIGFPFTYLVADQRWVPRRDVFLYPSEWPFPVQVWNSNCVGCHATYGQSRMDATSGAFDSRAAEIGIACEACHGPAAEHVRKNADPARRYLLHAGDDGDSTIFQPERTNHVRASETCGQCHAIRSVVRRDRFGEHGLEFRPGQNLEAFSTLVHYDASDLDQPGNERKRALMEGSFWPDGMVRVSGREMNGLAASPCFQRGQLSCLSCHSMHDYTGADDQLAAGMRGNAACAECHASLAADVASHSHHPSDSAGSLCYDCHMPYTTYGLLKAIRSHQVSSPSVAESVDVGRPNACNACHVDRSLAWTARWLEEWYGQQPPALDPEQARTPAAVEWALAGDAAQRALAAWYLGWDSAKQASNELGGDDWQAPILAELLDDPYAAVRYVAQRSLRTLPTWQDLDYDFVAPAAERQAARRAAITRAASTKPVDGLDAAALAALRARRDDRPVALLE
jgi:hypothetical protein